MTFFFGGSHFPSPPCLTFGFPYIQLLLLLLFSHPQLCQSVLHTICPVKTLLLWLLSTVLPMVFITGTLNPFISCSHSTASDPHLIPPRMPLWFFWYIDQLHQYASQQSNFTLPSLNFVEQNIREFLCLLLL